MSLLFEISESTADALDHIYFFLFFLMSFFSFFSPLRHLSINKNIPILLRVCNYAKKITTEKVTTIPIKEDTPSTTLSRGMAYQTVVAEQLRNNLNKPGFQVINNFDKGNKNSPIDILIKYNGVTIGIEVKDFDAMSFGSTTLVFFDDLKPVETLIDFNK